MRQPGVQVLIGHCQCASKLLLLGRWIEVGDRFNLLKGIYPGILSQRNSQISTKQKENKVLPTKIDYLGSKYHEQYLPVHMHMKKEIMALLLLMGIIC